MRIAFRVDATERIGGGHAMRCLTFADALHDRGAETLFIAGAMPGALEARIAANHGFAKIAAPGGLDRAGDDWHEPPLTAEAQEQDAAASLAALGKRADWMVVDHYLLGERWHSAARNNAERILVIDDLANRCLDCDLLLDQTFGRSAADYRPLVPAHAEVLAGANYALLRPEFARERPAAIERRKEGGPVERMLISLGTTDVGGVTARALEVALAAAPSCSIDVVLGERAPSLPRVREIAAADPRVAAHVDAPAMAQLMRDADLAIGAGGTTSWERCCLGLPSLTLVLADNQAGVARALSDAGASLTINDPGQIGAMIANLVAKRERLMCMSAAAFALADGLGAARVVDKLWGGAQSRRTGANEPFELRPATERDSEGLWLWRNDPATRQSSRTSDPIAWPEHSRWLQSVLADQDRHLLIAQQNGDPVGTVRFDRLDGVDQGYEVSINLRPGIRGQGSGRSILDTACALFAAENEGATLYATVHRNNAASRRLFEKCGFRDSGAFGEGGFHRYVLETSARSPDRARSTA